MTDRDDTDRESATLDTLDTCVREARCLVLDTDSGWRKPRLTCSDSSVHQTNIGVPVILQLYRKKTAYSLSNVVEADVQKEKNLNVINFKHKTK